MFEPFQGFMGKVAGRYGVKTEVEASKVCYYCDMAIEEVFKERAESSEGGIGAFIKAGNFKKGVVVIDVENPAWSQEVIMKKEKLLKNIAEKLGNDNVKNLRTRLKQR